MGRRRQETWIGLAILAMALASGPLRGDSAESNSIRASASEVLRGYMAAPRAVRAAVQKARPHIVTIETVGGIEIGAGGRQARKQIGGLARPGEGPTTGVIISSEGHIVSSTYNFIRKPRIITVTLADGARYVAELLGRDKTRKIVLLKIDADAELPAARFVDPDGLRVGQWAVSVGFGYGPEEPAVSAGIISATNRVAGRAVQTDANLSPANYGGPLIDIQGQIIGICTPLNPKARAQGAGAGSEWYDSGIGFAVTGHDLGPLLQRLKQGRTLEAGLIGVAPDPRPRDDGVLVRAVAPNSPAAKAGLKPGDLVEKVNGEPVTSLSDIKVALNRDFAGDTITVTWRREDQPRNAELTLETGPFKGNKPDNKQDANDNPEQAPPDDQDDPEADPEDAA
jgi:serine protease Do